MKHFLTLSLCFLALSLSAYGQTPCNNQTSITYHGDEYDLVHIGSQCWFKENLKTNKYSNGDLIPEVTSNIHWQEATNGAWCYWGNSDLNNNTYGKLYNWHVASDTRNVCPTEWEVPNKDRFDVLKEYINSLGVPVDAHGGALKEEGTTHWLAPNTGATNSTGFSALPGGYRDDYDGNFYLIGANSYGDGVTNYNCVGYFWGSDTSDNYDSYGNALGVHNGIGSINMNIYLKDNGLSIRCVRTQINTGCMNPTASNYDPVAVEDDSSCLFIGCVDNYACNFNEYATEDDGSCDYTCCPGPGCCNIGMTWNWELGICETSIPTDTNLDGCTDLNDLMDILANYGDCAVAEFTCGDDIEHEGYDYSTVQIGDQCWFSENCRYLPEVSPYSVGSETSPYYYVYDYLGTDVTAAMSTENYETYGVLYNWPAVMTEGICPSEWHIPSDGEFMEFADFLGGEVFFLEGGKMKEAGYDHWNPPNTGATNSSGFTGLPGGYSSPDGFGGIGTQGGWWSATDFGPLAGPLAGSFAGLYDLHYNNLEFHPLTIYHFYGFSARCVRD